MTIEQLFCLATSISSYFFSYILYDNVFVKSAKGEDINVENTHYWYCIKLWFRISWWWKFFIKWSRRSLQLPVNILQYSRWLFDLWIFNIEAYPFENICLDKEETIIVQIVFRKNARSQPQFHRKKKNECVLFFSIICRVKRYKIIG